eukprot:tig00000093_g3498.t1
MPRYLFYLVHRHLEFRLPELQALFELAGIPLVTHRPPFAADDSPFLYVDLPNEEAARTIASRAILTRNIFECWAEGADWDGLLRNLDEYPVERMEAAGAVGPGVTFRFEVEGFGRTYTMEEKLDMINRFAGRPFAEGKVRIKPAPDNVFHIIEDWGHNLGKGLGAGGAGEGEVRRPPGRPDLPMRAVYLCREVATGRRDLVGRYDLKKRAFLGPTSMDAELSLLIANLALARPGALAYDPFVGTAGILVACAHFGARVLGSDIDKRIIRGKVPGKNLWTNFKQYGLEPPVDVIQCDILRRVWRQGEWFDAVVCDPPPSRPAPQTPVPRLLYPHPHPSPKDEMKPGLVPVTLGDTTDVLLDFAASTLVMGGRLVYWLPCTPEYEESDCPQHPSLRVVANCCQVLTSKWHRRLVVSVKVAPYINTLGDLLSLEEGYIEGLGPLRKQSPALADLSAKVMKDPNRLDERLLRKKAAKVPTAARADAAGADAGEPAPAPPDS